MFPVKTSSLPHRLHAEIEELALGLVGVPFRHQGRSRITGLDCAGVAILIGQELGLTNGFDTVAYSARPNVRQFRETMLAVGCTPLPITDAQPGDLMRISIRGWPVHVAVLVSGNRMVHAWSPRKRVLLEAIHDKQRASFRDAMRFPNG